MITSINHLTSKKAHPVKVDFNTFYMEYPLHKPCGFFKVSSLFHLPVLNLCFINLYYNKHNMTKQNKRDWNL